MSRKLVAALTLLIVGSAALPACVRTVPASAPSGGPDVVHVAPPMGERDADRASILAALERVPPAGTVQFGAGTYLVGEIISVPTPGITLLGHPDGTMIRGCNDADFTRDVATRSCNGLELAGRRQTVRNITFENVFWGLHLGCCWGEWSTHQRADGSTFERPNLRPTEGGHLVEDNTFRRAASGIRVNGDWTDPAVVRDNRFIDNWHAISINGHTVHLLDNEFSVPEPQRVPFFGFPWDAISISPSPPILAGDSPPTCIGNVVAGNRIEGYIEGVRIGTSTPGSTCRDNVIRDNTIEVARVLNPDPTEFNLRDPADSTFVGVPVALQNDLGSAAALAGNVIEGNRIRGAEGVAIEVRNASGNRIANNTIVSVRVRQPYPGNTMGGRGAEGLPLEWDEANGSGIWLSRGSDENEIAGNTFEDIAAYAVVLEGDRNRVETRSAGDVVRDVGSGNQVTASAHVSRFVEARGVRLHYLDFGGSGLPLIFVHDWYEDAHTWVTMAPPYADAYRVLAMTRRGYGESDDLGWGYDVATQSEDILGFMDALGIERAVLVGRHPTTQDMTWIAEHHPQRLAGLVYLYHAVWPSPGDARMLRDRTFAEMFMRYGGCWMGEEAYERGAPRLLYRPHYADDEGRRIDVPALSFTHPQDAGAGAGELNFLDVTLTDAMSADPGGGVCDEAGIAAPVAYLTALANKPERLGAIRALVPTSDERRRYAAAFERAFASNLRIVRLDGAVNYREDPEPLEPHIRTFLEEVSARERALQFHPAGPRATAADSVDAFIHERMASLGIPGLSLAVLRGTEVIKAAAYGRSSLELDVATSPATLFPYASMTKAVAATAILRLVEGGRLSLDDRVGDLIPELPETWSSVPLRRLLDQSSGLPDVLRPEVDVLPYTIREAVLAPSPDSAMAALSTMPLQFSPGERSAYNHTNSMLLAMLLQLIDGRTIEDYVREEFATPLGLSSFVYGDSRVVVPRRASWYTRFDYSSGQPVPGDARPVWLEYPTFLHAAAGLNGSAVDLGRFIAAVASGELLGEAARREMWTAASLNDGSPARLGPWGLGLGWLVDDRSARPSVTMMGAGSSAFKHFVDDDLTVVILTNLQGADPWGLVDGVANMYLRLPQPRR